MAEKGKPRRVIYTPHPDPIKAAKGETAKALTVDFEIKEEHWNIYELQDGTRVKVKASVSQVNRALDPVTEKPMYKKSGEPIYGVGIGVVINFEYSEKALRD